MAVRFIPPEIVPIVHADQIKRYGGILGIRDTNLLDSALAQARMTVGGKFVHPSIYEKAAAYGYHLCKNHPFIDGNKRVAFIVMDIFLQKNGWEIKSSEEEAYSMMIELADGKMSKPLLAKWIKEHSVKLKR
jgi:death-on-curing protein